MLDALSTPLNPNRIADLGRKVTSSHLCWAEIDLDAVANNVRTIRSILSPDVSTSWQS